MLLRRGAGVPRPHRGLPDRAGGPGGRPGRSRCQAARGLPALEGHGGQGVPGPERGGPAGLHRAGDPLLGGLPLPGPGALRRHDGLGDGPGRGPQAPHPRRAGGRLLPGGDRGLPRPGLHPAVPPRFPALAVAAAGPGPGGPPDRPGRPAVAGLLRGGAGHTGADQMGRRPGRRLERPVPDGADRGRGGGGRDRLPAAVDAAHRRTGGADRRDGPSPDEPCLQETALPAVQILRHPAARRAAVPPEHRQQRPGPAVLADRPGRPGRGDPGLHRRLPVRHRVAHRTPASCG